MDFTINTLKIVCFIIAAFPPHVFMFQSLVDSENKPVQLLTTLDNSELDLLILEYIKVCTNSIHIDKYFAFFNLKSPLIVDYVSFRLIKLAQSSRPCTKIQSSSLR